MKAENVLMGKRIAEARRRRSWTKADLARKAGVAPSYITRIERGQFGRPSVDQIKLIADALGVSVMDLTEPPREAATASIHAAVAEIFRADEAPLVAEIVQDLAQRSDHEREQIINVLRMLIVKGNPPTDGQ